MTDALLVLVACASRSEAETIAAAAVDARLAACAQVAGGVRSFYWWQGRRESADETLLLLKTTEAHFATLEAAIRRLHAYDTPEIIALPIAHASAPYLAWLHATLP